MNLIVLSLLAGICQAVLIHENVVFHKTNDITTTRARWMVTMVIDLNPFDLFINKIHRDIQNAAGVASAIVEYYEAPKKQGFLNTFTSLNKEIDNLNQTHLSIISTFTDYKSLHPRVTRSLLPIVGKALSFLFGVISEGDLDQIKESVKKLADSQQTIIHVVEKAISVLDISRVQITENRRAITGLIVALQQIDGKLSKLTAAIEKQVKELENFIEMYLQLDLIIDEVKQMTQRAMFFLENLRLQLNLLSLGHLSPSIISPTNLRALLLDIQARLPSTLKLPNDPQKDLWYFYKFLTCTTVLDVDKILIVISLPLLDLNGEFEIYKAISIPLPLPIASTGNSELSNMVATYDLETPNFMINMQRTSYALLSPEETQRCNDHLVNFCALETTIFPINLSKLCVIALFTQNKENIGQFCRKTVRLDTLLPTAVHLFHNFWVIAGKKEIRFSTVCHGLNTNQKTIIVKPPLGVIQLEKSCFASSDFLTLAPLYMEGQSDLTLNSTANDLLVFKNTSNIGIWQPFLTALPNLTNFSLPKELKTIPKIPMDQLITKLKNLKPVSINNNRFPAWGYVLIGFSLSIIIGVGLFFYCKKSSSIRNSACCSNPQFGLLQ